MKTAAKPIEITNEILYGVPFEQYRAMPEVNASSLQDMMVSPRLYRLRQSKPQPDTDTLRRGRAVHTAILEPDRFVLEFTVWRSRRAGLKWDAFQEANADKTILTEKQYENVLRVRDAARSHSVIKRYLAEDGRAEVTILWTHPRTGLRCKSRIDWLCSVIGDVKTTKNPDPGRFAWDAARLGYWLRMAFYQDAVAAVGLGALPTKLFGAQNAEPYDAVVFGLRDEDVQRGREQYETAMDRIRECRSTGVYPGIAPDEEVTLFMPASASPETNDVDLGDDAIGVVPDDD